MKKLQELYIIKAPHRKQGVNMKNKFKSESAANAACEGILSIVNLRGWGIDRAELCVNQDYDGTFYLAANNARLSDSEVHELIMNIEKR